jgi:hypothetical protein
MTRLITACVVLGLLTTIAVSWAAACLSDLRYANVRTDTAWASTGIFRVSRYPVSGGMLYRAYLGPPAMWQTANDSGDTPLELMPTWMHAHLGEPRLSRARSLRQTEVAVRALHAWGWPMAALFCEFERADESNRMIVSGGVPVADSRDLKYGFLWCAPVTLPLKPIWTGLCADTILYAGAWIALAASPLALRRHLRLRRNHCPHCNYDLRATPTGQPCPECGVTSARRVAPTAR